MSEPIFNLVKDDDPQMRIAHRFGGDSVAQFEALIGSASADASRLAKLRFRDPDLSEELGEDQFFYLWLAEVHFHEPEQIFSGEFFEVPAGFEKWHAVGSRLGFEADDIFDWMVNDDGRVEGGYSLRLTRSRMDESEWAEFDEYIGADEYAPPQFGGDTAMFDPSLTVEPAPATD